MTAAAQPAPLPLTSPDAWPERARRSVPGAVSRDVLAGALLIPEEQRPTVTMIESGILLLAAPIDGPVVFLSALGPGEVLGQECLSAFPPRPEAVGVAPACGPAPRPLLQPQARALVSSRVLSLPAEELREACLGDPVLCAGLAWRLADLSSRLGRRLAVALSLPVVARVADALWELARAGGRRTPSGVVIELPVTQDLLGSMAGTTRESVSRALHTLSARGCVRRMGRAFVLPTETDVWPRAGPGP